MRRYFVSADPVLVIQDLAVKKIVGSVLALLLIAVVTLLLDSGSVHRIAPDSLPGERAVAEPGQKQSFPVSSPAVTTPVTSRLAVDERFASAADLVTDQQVAGYVKVGTFGNNWPGKVTEIATDRDGIRFVRQDGTAHNYNKFDGYEMKMVRLMAGKKETIMVFRSRDKR